MAEHNDLGRTGEELAQSHLRQEGYTILAQNWRSGRAEIDLLCRRNKTLVIVEVKSRSSREFENPKDRVGKQKQVLLIRAANAYIEQYSIDLDCRFDVITVWFIDGKQSIEHVEDAFSPDL